MDNFTFRFLESDGSVSEIEITPEQALDIGAGVGFSYSPRDERILIDDDGTVIRR